MLCSTALKEILTVAGIDPSLANSHIGWANPECAAIFRYYLDKKRITVDGVDNHGRSISVVKYRVDVIVWH